MFSQPIIELCLSISTFNTYEKGYDRYNFRKAITESFPQYSTNLWRKDKGETTGVAQLCAKANKNYILALCMEGKCVQHGIINKNLLYDEIHSFMEGKPDYLWPISNLISLEIFF